MAGPVTHVIFAQKALNGSLSDKNQSQFIAGNLFPDIRYTGVIDRDSTHFTGVTMADVSAETDAFKAGVLLHSLVDEQRENMVVRSGVYDVLPESHLSAMALKICEDIELYQRLGGRLDIFDYSRGVLTRESTLGISADSLRRWYAINAEIIASPSLDRYRFFLSQIGFSDVKLAALFEVVDLVMCDKIVDRYINDMYNNLI